MFSPSPLIISRDTRNTTTIHEKSVPFTSFFTTVLPLGLQLLHARVFPFYIRQEKTVSRRQVLIKKRCQWLEIQMQQKLHKCTKNLSSTNITWELRPCCCHSANEMVEQFKIFPRYYQDVNECGTSLKDCLSSIFCAFFLLFALLEDLEHVFIINQELIISSLGKKNPCPFSDWMHHSTSLLQLPVLISSRWTCSNPSISFHTQLAQGSIERKHHKVRVW